MSTYTKKDMLSEIKAYCKNLGFTFKVNDRKLIDNEKCYKLVKRYTNDVITDKFGNNLSNFTLETGYENMISGYFDGLAQDNIREKIADTIRYFLKLDEQCYTRDYNFIAKVSKRLDDKYGINVVDNTHAHDKLCEQLDIFFDQ